MEPGDRVRDVALWLAVLALGHGLASYGQVHAVLGTKQTTVQLRAGMSARSSPACRAKGCREWRNTASESLIDSVEIDGRIVPVHWKVSIANSSRVTPNAVTFVYRSASPRLRLSWQWKARADFGPLEHSIRIENLDSHEMWLPLQDAFDFRFPLASEVALNELYIDKGAGKPSDVGTHRTCPITPGIRLGGQVQQLCR